MTFTEDQLIREVTVRTKAGALAREIASALGINERKVAHIRRKLQQAGRLPLTKRGYRPTGKAKRRYDSERAYHPPVCVDGKGRDRLLEALQRAYAPESRGTPTAGPRLPAGARNACRKEQAI